MAISAAKAVINAIKGAIPKEKFDEWRLLIMLNCEGVNIE